MMQIVYHKAFLKSYRKLPTKIQVKVESVIELFKKDTFHPLLRNHPLRGDLAPRRAISVTGDLRIIFEEHESYTLVLLLDVGTHSQVYGM